MARKMSDALLSIQESIMERERLAVLEQEEKIKAEKEHIEKLNEEKEKMQKKDCKANTRKAYKEFVETVKGSLLEAAFDSIFSNSIGDIKLSTMCDDSIEYCKSLVSNYIDEECPSKILCKMEESTPFLSELALAINDSTAKLLEGVDETDPDTYKVDSDEEVRFFENISGEDDVEDLCDTIKERVSRATADFIEKNMMDKYDIEDIMNNTKAKIDSIKSGDKETDEAIAQESANIMRKKIKSVSNRPHGLFEHVVINTSKAVLANEQLQDKYTVDGKLNMGAIVEKAECYYTMLEMLNTLQLEKIDEEYILGIIGTR